MYQATRLFASNLNAKMAQRYVCTFRLMCLQNGIPFKEGNFFLILVKEICVYNFLKFVLGTFMFYKNPSFLRLTGAFWDFGKKILGNDNSVTNLSKMLIFFEKKRLVIFT